MKAHLTCSPKREVGIHTCTPTHTHSVLVPAWATELTDLNTVETVM